MISNPFVTNGYAGAEYFCDREEETRTILELLTNGNNIALMSPRRLGKTDLIRHSFSRPEIVRDYYTFVIDIYSTSSVAEMVNVFGKTIIDALRPQGRAVWERFLSILSSLRSEITFDINGQPIWSLGMSTIRNPELTLDEIFRYLGAADKPCLVAIDEFQQIAHYSDGALEALLRTHIQRCSNAHFIFSGSRRHLMGEMFTFPSRPFYQSVTLMNLRPLDKEHYKVFAKTKFEERNRRLDTSIVDILFDTFSGITSYIQRVMNVLFMKTAEGSLCSSSMVEEAISYTIDIASDTYSTLLMQMPHKQREVLVAIGRDGGARNVMSGAFAKRHHLPSPSSVSSAVKGLLEKDLITVDDGVYTVQDRFLALWIERNVL